MTLLGEHASVDWSPALAVMLVGALVAAVVAAALWWRHRAAAPGAWLQALTLLTLFLTFDLVLFGAFTRLSDAGLGCPDWPGCYGSASPLGAQPHINAAQSALPTGPVTHGKAWIEMLHRYLATAVGALVLALVAGHGLAGRRRAVVADNDAAVSRRLPAVTLAWVCVQGAFGAFTVTMKLQPAIVTLHLLGGLVLLALLAAQVQRQSNAPLPLPSGLPATLAVLAALVIVQIVLGAWVSTNYAVLACTDFPTCQGSWWPAMDFAQGFAVWRELGRSVDGEWLPFSALTAIHYVHRAFSMLVFAAIAVFAMRLWRHGRMQGVTAARRYAIGFVAVGLWQAASGLSNVVLGWPLVAALAHTGGAAALVVLLTGLAIRVHQANSRSVAAAPRTAALEAGLHHV